MKKAIALCLISILVFVGVWAIKPKTPISRPDSYKNGLTGQGNWWVATVSADEVPSVWKLDKEIPDNYLPVPGGDELYMVIDQESGTILKYRHRTKTDDNTWIWEDVNPDIPENYEAVNGLDNVYKVVDQDGNVKYYRYIRNKDNDTFAFVEVDENGNDIEIVTPTGSEIPDNYAHMGENVYAVLNQYGVVVAYKERIANADGSYSWVNKEKPQVSGSDMLNADYSEWMTQIGQLGESDIIGGISLVPQVISGPSELDLPSIPDPQVPQVQTPSNPQNPSGYQGSSLPAIEQNGVITEKETIYSTVQNGGYIVTTETVITRVYDLNGELLSTQRSEPVEVSRKKIEGSTGATFNISDIASSLDAEVARISYGVTFNESLEASVLSELNAFRADRGFSPLSMQRGDTPYKLAKARAAVLAQANSSDYINPLYGDLSQMMALYNLTGTPSETIWKASNTKTASQIAARFMAEPGSSNAILSPLYTTVGIAIAEYNGYLYIEIVFIG